MKALIATIRVSWKGASDDCDRESHGVLGLAIESACSNGATDRADLADPPMTARPGSGNPIVPGSVGRHSLELLIGMRNGA